MAYEELEAHLLALGARPRSEPLPDETWAAVGLAPGDVPPVARWLLDHFAGSTFARGARLVDGDRVVDELGWLLDGEELVAAYESTRDCLPAAVLPFEDDGADNHLCLDLATGQVLRHVHDAPLDGRHLVPRADSLESFLAALRPGED
ncbi:SMI1/KNR4 family protein [Actinopolymorpha rutila]|uniref:Knr4/Smi1-like domain-containing protein n=1 Tax=Actinopolymorpha rutila TaxID=446787 RepID=A0A852ZCF7_9ACTN|nr:SMI1/KNR4 family protein [Actinopolymorpha rutila]NYH90827.1 hypothetical protein [Actinopolymorpha rutila]